MKITITWQKNIEDWPFKVRAMNIDPFKTALLIIDMQKDSASASKVLSNNVKLLDFFRQHSLKVFYCRIGGFLPDGRDYNIKRRLTVRPASSDDPLKIRCKGSPSYEIREELEPMPGEIILDKNTGSAFNSSPIDRYLHVLGIQNLVICGVGSSGCVENTARDAADRGYNVILVEDACGGGSSESHVATMHTFDRVFGTVKSTLEVIADFSRGY